MFADVAELADAHDSGSCARNGVEVQVLSSAPIPECSTLVETDSNSALAGSGEEGWSVDCLCLASTTANPTLSPRYAARAADTNEGTKKASSKNPPLIAG
jgi:hypothetical protein